jgi:sugar phosphate permease
MPIAFITYSLAYLDRANFGFATAAGMAKDLNITPARESLIGALFFLGYFFFQIPCGVYAERRSAKKLVFVSLILWGACATLTGIVTSSGWLIVIRFALGVVEAAVELCLNLGDGVNQAANLASSTTSIPSRNLAPLTAFGNWF